MEYTDFLLSKRVESVGCGIDISREHIHPMLFDFQKDIVKWALKRGKAALFTMTGTGKTLMQLEWARNIHNATKSDILILSPLAVSHQTAREGEKIGLTVNLCSSQDDVKPGVNITNYEKLHKFTPDVFGGIVLDESSILKSYSGSTRNEIIASFYETPYRLACTATPAPNDYMELGNHSEFLGAMTRTEMLSMFFTHDGGDTAKWRLKGHAVARYWEWLASWAVVLTNPSDLGYSDDGFILPALNITEQIVPTTKPMDGFLFPMTAQTLQERQQARRDSTLERVQKCADIVNATQEPFLVWCDLNAESDALARAIPGSVEVRGIDDDDHKTNSMLAFSRGEIRVLVTKPSICGFGMNWQHCRNMAFVGLSDSFEAYFQAVRRCWRFGQEKPVNVYIITGELEGAVSANIKAKEMAAMNMIREMVEHTKEITSKNVRSLTRQSTEYDPQIEMEIPEWMCA